MEKFLENLQEAKKTIKTVDHIAYVTFPLIKEKNLIIKMLTELKTAVAGCINAILQYEYIYKRITLYQNPKTNFKTFIEKCSKKYNITEQEKKSIVELFELSEKHKKSSIEFLKNEKVVILSDNCKQETISLEKIKEFLDLSKKIAEKSERIILG